MFKKTRRRIVVAIMAALVLLWAGTIGSIYLSSYLEMFQFNNRLLKQHFDTYVVMPSSEEEPRPGDGFSPIFSLSTFYTLVYDENGQLIKVENMKTELHTNDELKTYSQKILTMKKDYGSIDNLAYYKGVKDNYTIVTMMDNEYLSKTAVTILRYTMIIGGLSLVVFFFIALFLSKKIVNPLEESYKKQKQFISDAGHELKTPVSIVSANVDILSREIPNNQWLSNIQQENERMGTLITQLLDLARTENPEIVMETIDFSDLCQGQVLPFESVIYEKKMSLETNIQTDLHIKGNKRALEELVNILIDNAVSHSTTIGTIRVELVKQHKDIKLSVINPADEIPVEERNNLFERFYRQDTTRNSSSNHYGLGLAIAKNVCDMHNAKIDVLCYDGLVEFKIVFTNI